MSIVVKSTGSSTQNVCNYLKNIKKALFEFDSSRECRVVTKKNPSTSLGSLDDSLLSLNLNFSSVCFLDTDNVVGFFFSLSANFSFSSSLNF